MGERGTGPTVGPRRRRGGHRPTDGPADAGAPQAETLAPSSVVVAPGTTGCGLCGSSPRHGSPRYASSGGRGNGAVRGRENPSATPDAPSPHLGRPTRPTRAGRTRVHPPGGPAPLCRFGYAYGEGRRHDGRADTA